MRDAERRVLQGNCDSNLRRAAATDGIWAEKHFSVLFSGCFVGFGSASSQSVDGGAKTRPSTGSLHRCLVNIRQAGKKISKSCVHRKDFVGRVGGCFAASDVAVAT